MPWSGIAGAAIGAAGSLIGGGISASSARNQMAMQKEFAQNGVRWKVADAKAAGIHPLAALGAQTFSYNPVAVGDYGVADAFQQMGQGVTRAQEAKQLAVERAANDVVRKLQIRGLELDNKMKEQQIQSDYTRQAYELADRIAAKTAAPPPMPIVNNPGKGGPSSSEPGVSPFWQHYRNFDWLMSVPAGDLKDYVGENAFVNFLSQLAYASAAFSGDVKPDNSALTSQERAKLQSGLYQSVFTPGFGWRVEPNLKRYLSRAIGLLSPNLARKILRALQR